MMQTIAITAVLSTFSTSMHGGDVDSVGLENMAEILRGNVRLIAMGDSYSSPYFSRVPMACLRVWPIPNIAALGGGATVNSHLIECGVECHPVSLIQASDDLGYRTERYSQELYFALPVRGLREIYTSNSFDDEGSDELFEFRLNNSGSNYLSNGVHGLFSEIGDEVAFRLLYRCPSNTSLQLDALKVQDNGADVGVVELRNNARSLWHLGEDPHSSTRPAVSGQINASGIDFPSNNSVYRKVQLDQMKPLAGSNQYFEPAGCVYYHRDESGIPEVGLYYNHLSDDSWSYLGFGCDTVSNANFDKKFSLEQFTYWLDVTTLDRNQPTVFFWYLAPEALSYTTAKERMANMIAQADQAALQIGLASVQHLIVVSHFFDLSGDEENDRQFLLNQQNAAFDLAQDIPSIAAASIYAATDGTLFSGTGAVPWLLYHGFDSFEFGGNAINLIDFSNGDLLDVGNVHPKNPESAAFFSAILSEIIRESGCPADVTGDGHINVSDILAVINHMGEEFADEDINNDGIVNILDLLLVVDTWGDCWPMQSPFNTPAFRDRSDTNVTLFTESSSKKR